MPIRTLLLFTFALLASCIHAPAVPSGQVDWRPPVAGALLLASAGLHVSADALEPDACIAATVVADVSVSASAAILSSGASPRVPKTHVDWSGCVEGQVVDTVALPNALDRALAEGLTGLRLQVDTMRTGCEAATWLDALLAELADGADDVVFAVAHGRTLVDLPGRPVAACP